MMKNNSVSARRIIVAPAMVIPGIAAVLYFNVLDGMFAARVVYLAAKVFILLYPLAFIRVCRLPGKAFAFNVREASLGTAAGALILITGALGLQLTALWEVISGASEFARHKAETFGVLLYYVPFAFIISFIHSLLEEYYWRWFVYGTLRSIVPRGGAHILAAAAFALHHIVVLKFFFPWPVTLILAAAVVLGGVLFSFLYQRHDCVWGAWAAHVGADLVIFYAGWKMLF